MENDYPPVATLGNHTLKSICITTLYIFALTSLLFLYWNSFYNILGIQYYANKLIQCSRLKSALHGFPLSPNGVMKSSAYEFAGIWIITSPVSMFGIGLALNM